MTDTVPKSAGKRPQPKGGSRKGIPNKVTADVKAMILAALDKAGGIDYLLAQAKANPNAFLTLVGKVLPLTLTGDADNPVAVAVIERRIARPS